MACTQMIIVQLHTPISLGADSEGKRVIEDTVDSLQKRRDVRRVYWGTGHETPDKLHLHIVRERVHQHYDFLASPDYSTLKAKLTPISIGSPTVRHAFLSEYTSKCKALGKGAAFTGTAIYVDTTRAWEYAWNLWATIVPHVKGCAGVAGGYIVEPIDGHERCFIAWVGWDSLEEHEAYHHTQHWRDRQKILRQGNRGYREYGHVVFNSRREKSKALL